MDHLRQGHVHVLLVAALIVASVGVHLKVATLAERLVTLRGFALEIVVLVRQARSSRVLWLPHLLQHSQLELFLMVLRVVDVQVGFVKVYIHIYFIVREKIL